MNEVKKGSVPLSLKIQYMLSGLLYAEEGLLVRMSRAANKKEVHKGRLYLIFSKM
jgi:hypothetical protein